MNRTIPPPSRPIEQFNITKAETVHLSGGIPLHVIRSGQHDIIQFEIILRSGRWYEPSIGLSWFTAKMLAEGSRYKTSQEISKFFEFFGAQFKISPGIDLVTLSAIFLGKQFEKIIPVIAECLFEPAFPETELETIKDLQIQELKVNNERSSYVATREIRRQLFGNYF